MRLNDDREDAGTFRQDVLTVASATFEIRCDDRAYDAAARQGAWDLWCLALELLEKQERHPARASLGEDTAPIIRVSDLTAAD